MRLARIATVACFALVALVSYACSTTSKVTVEPTSTAAPDELLVRGDCSRQASDDAQKVYGEDASLNPETDRFNAFCDDVILIGLAYGRDETASLGSDFEELYSDATR